MQLPSLHAKIYEIRNQKIMLNFDFAVLYEIKTRILNQPSSGLLNDFPQILGFN